MAEPMFDALAPGQNRNINEWLTRHVDGKSQRAYKLARDSMMMSFEATGQSRPATILNFNPVPLVLDGGLERVGKVPSCIDDVVPDRERIVFKHKGRSFKASVLTIRNPIPYPWITDVAKDEAFGEAGVFQPRICAQIDIAHAFLQSYTVGLQNSSRMGGVVVFQGDRRSLDPKRRSEKGLEIDVPYAITLPDRRAQVVTKSGIFEELCGEALELQKIYCNSQTQQAQSYWDQDEQRGNITPVHRIWHQYEMDMGWRTTAAPWITLQNESAELCKSCSAPKKRPNAYFCHECRQPYDPLQAYLDGEIPLDHPKIYAIKDEESWKKIRAEEARRKALREGIEPPAGKK